MANLTQILKHLQRERTRAKKGLHRLEKAIAAVGKLVSNSPGRATRTQKPKARRKLSAAARLRIARAQRARWRKVRKAQRAERKGGKVRTMSVAARKRIAKAQRARWRKVRKAQRASKSKVKSLPEKAAA